MSDPAPPLPPLLATFDEALATLGRQDDPRFTVVMRHGSMSVELYAPRGVDPQSPHGQDELYVVARGTGRFVCGDREVRFSPGDVLFVPAGATHRFIDFSVDLAVWVLFYGPRGGESPGAT
ncbi:cupin domain-containing protein [Polyangium mundeleinium]|uniref:Cupin domain-containing protein n=1 Tax=Polyangium mundeleinium TaxID=2995306 RepID=A0ABT5ENR4_9BACT|nr:cupin domain-containing protein [Polyangium mundeleinium]MDC0743002.1 cupin domain-containing protein [Polyangium mundeleinium]